MRAVPPPSSRRSAHAPRPGDAPARAERRPPGEVRLIGGRWKRTRLPVADHPGLRPTPDRVRETLFNWLGQDLAGWRVLDAFAGTGALGFEAASRGAAAVTMVEAEPRLAAALQAIRQRLDAAAVQVRGADALAWMRGAPRAAFDLVLLDPPFGADLFDAAVRAARPLLSPGGWLYLEADRAFDAPACAAWGLRLHRQGRAGMVHYHLCQVPAPADAPTTLASSGGSPARPDQESPS
ncbi:MAG: rRNA ((966)-N(2))-methyltransferase RsmD [Pseudomonadota bacterium]|jgi:16S rRNA (guanine(966)-N(2))-methyltransferase RsmD